MKGRFTVQQAAYRTLAQCNGICTRQSQALNSPSICNGVIFACDFYFYFNHL